MDQSIVNIIMDLISNGLFPIVVSVGLFYALYVLFKAYREDHKDNVDALQNNTVTMQRLCDKLDYLADAVRKEN